MKTYRKLKKNNLYSFICFFVYLGLVNKIEQGITDHTEFLNYNNEMEKWLTNANETLEDCTGFGDENDTKQKLQAIIVRSTNFLS